MVHPQSAFLPTPTGKTKFNIYINETSRYLHPLLGFIL